MNSPFGIFKRDPQKSFIVNYAPIFSHLNLFEKNLIIQKSNIVDYAKGALIYKQYAPPDAFYCVITGRVRIFSAVAGEEETLEYLNCGKYFGMISVLTGDPHSVSAEAINDSKLLRITQEDFQYILKKIPRLAIDLSRTLSRRLRKEDLKDKRVFESNIISIFSASKGTGRTVYATNLALSLKKETAKNVILVDVSNTAIDVSRVLGFKGLYRQCMIKLDAPLPKDEIIKDAIYKDAISGLSVLNVMHSKEKDSYAASLNTLLTFLTSSYHYIVVDLSVAIGPDAFFVLNQSDLLHIITDYIEDNLRSARSLVSDLFSKVNYPQEKIKIIINASKEGGYLSYAEVDKILDYKVYAFIPDFQEHRDIVSGPPGRLVLDNPALEYSKAVRRIARELGDVRVGLALGAGAAFGLAHVGVIKVLEKENIPIDMVSGSSMGALVGAFWACGLSGEDIEEIMLKYDNNKKKSFHLLADFCFPKLSVAKGKRIRNFLKEHLADKTFQDVRFPFRVVSCNLSKRQGHIFGSGRLVDAVMASIAIPGIFAPATIGSDVIIDGGIIEPVPIGTLVKAGIKKIIAVNVLPSPEDIARSYELNFKHRAEEQARSRKGGFLPSVSYDLYAYIYKKFSPNILDIIVNSIQTMEHSLAEIDCQKADVVINPTIAGVDWFEFFKVGLLIKKGQEECYSAISQIKNIISEQGA